MKLFFKKETPEIHTWESGPQDSPNEKSETT